MKLLITALITLIFGFSILSAGATEKQKTSAKKKTTASSAKSSTSKKSKKPAKKVAKTSPTKKKSSAIKIKGPVSKKGSKSVHPDNVPANTIVDLDYENTSVSRTLHYFMDPLKVRLKFLDGSDKVKVTGSFSNRPWREAMESILQQAGLKYEVVQGVVVVSKDPNAVVAEDPNAAVFETGQESETNEANIVKPVAESAVLPPPVPSDPSVPTSPPEATDQAAPEVVSGAVAAPSGPEIPMDPPPSGPEIPMDPPSGPEIPMDPAPEEPGI